MILSSTMFAVRRLLRQLPAGCAVLVLILAPILCNSHAEEDSDSILMGKYVKFYSTIRIPCAPGSS
jgi:hypothetical protein